MADLIVRPVKNADFFAAFGDFYQVNTESGLVKVKLPPIGQANKDERIGVTATPTTNTNKFQLTPYGTNTVVGLNAAATPDFAGVSIVLISDGISNWLIESSSTSLPA